MPSLPHDHPGDIELAVAQGSAVHRQRQFHFLVTVAGKILCVKGCNTKLRIFRINRFGVASIQIGQGHFHADQGLIILSLDRDGKLCLVQHHDCEIL